MPEKTAFLYQLGPRRQRILELAFSLSTIQGFLIDPATRSILSVDTEGESKKVPETDFWRTATNASEISFLWQFGPKDCRYCCARELGNLSIIELALEGYTALELYSLRSKLETHFVATPDTAVGLVFDSNGTMEEYDWDRFFIHKDRIHRKDYHGGPPDLIGLRTDEAIRLGPLATEMRSHNCGPLTLLENVAAERTAT